MNERNRVRPADLVARGFSNHKSGGKGLDTAFKEYHGQTQGPGH